MTGLVLGLLTVAFSFAIAVTIAVTAVAFTCLPTGTSLACVTPTAFAGGESRWDKKEQSRYKRPQE